MVTAVSAHDIQLVESNPSNGALLEEAPSDVFARFDEEIVYPDSWIKVFNAAGEQVDAGDGGVDLNSPERDSMIVQLHSPLPDDVYTVEWHGMLLDGDATDGAFTFTVGNPSTDTSSVTAADSSHSATGLNNFIAWIAAGIGLVISLGLLTYMWRNKVY